jgi:hypothetical protein
VTLTSPNVLVASRTVGPRLVCHNPVGYQSTLPSVSAVAWVS